MPEKGARSRYAYGTGSMGWEPEPEFTHLQVVRNEITKALHGETADLALVAQFLDEIAVHDRSARSMVAERREGAIRDGSSVYVFDTYAVEPAFHGYKGIDREKDADVTKCGRVIWSLAKGTEAISIARFNAERFARPCRRCFLDA